MGQGTQYVAGIVHFGADPGLERCLASLRAQSQRPMHLVVVDHDPCEPGDERRATLARAYPEVEWVHAPNGGYAAGANRVIELALSRVPELDSILVLNPDVELEPEFAAALLDELNRRPEVALASGKLLRPGARLIDSAGIEMRRSRRFHDRGSEQPDDGRYGEVETVFAVSGAALMIRRAALPSLALEGEIFDEDFFTYHEDTDLAWRARKLGWQCLYVPAARAIHVRGWRRGVRDQVVGEIRRHSWKNRYLELLKNESPLTFLRDLPFILPVELVRLGFALLVDRTLLGAYLDAARQARRALRKRAMLGRSLSREHARAGAALAGTRVARWVSDWTGVPGRN